MTESTRRQPESAGPHGTLGGLKTIAVLACLLGLSTACGFPPLPARRSYPAPPSTPASPAPRLRLLVNTTELNFEPTVVGTPSVPHAVDVVRLAGATPSAPLFAVRLQDGSEFTARTTWDWSTPEGSCAVAVLFRPRAAGPAEETMVLQNLRDQGDTVTIRLRGFGVAPVVPPPAR